MDEVLFHRPGRPNYNFVVFVLLDRVSSNWRKLPVAPVDFHPFEDVFKNSKLVFHLGVALDVYVNYENWRDYGIILEY